MLSTAQYAAFASALTARGVTLRTSADQYRTAHELPGWYPTLASATPASAWTATDKEEDFRRACRTLGAGAAIVRDYVKSIKHYWDEAAFISDLADQAAAWKVASRLRELREDEFTGGFVLRRFEDFASAEVRTWWIHGTCTLITSHPDTPEQLPPPDLDLAGIGAPVAALGLPFITVDLVRRSDGVWRAVEVGDGQVSDRPATSSADEFMTAVLPAAARVSGLRVS